MVRLAIPGTLAYRDLLLRVVAASCKLVPSGRSVQDVRHQQGGVDEFEAHVVSACGEAFNNIAIHGYANRTAEQVEIEIEIGTEALTVRLKDRGATFDPTNAYPESIQGLPMSGMGLYIIHACMDSVSYCAGNPPATPNVLSLIKHYR